MALTTSVRHVLRGLAFAGVAAAGYLFAITSDRVAAQPPAAPNTLPPVMQTPSQPQSERDHRVVAYIYGNMPITRAELGEFLIARGGHEKLELLVNKKIIEIEAARRGVNVTIIEILRRSRGRPALAGDQPEGLRGAHSVALPQVALRVGRRRHQAAAAAHEDVPRSREGLRRGHPEDIR